MSQVPAAVWMVLVVPGRKSPLLQLNRKADSRALL